MFRGRTLSGATLPVTFNHLPPFHESHFVPMPAFASLKIADLDLRKGSDSIHGYLQPSLEAAKVMRAVDIAESILPVSPPAFNASWEINTPAPRLSCEHVNAKLLGAIKENIAEVLTPVLQRKWRASSQRDTIFRSLMFNYISWTNANRPEELPCRLNSILHTHGTFRPNASEVARMALANRLDFHNANYNTLYVAALPRMIVDTDGRPDNVELLVDILQEKNETTTAVEVRNAMDWSFVGATVLRCELVASEYTLRFSSHGPSQGQDIEVLHVADIVPSPASEDQWRVMETGCFHPRHKQANSSECDIGIEILHRWSYSALVGAANFMGTHSAWESDWFAAEIEFGRDKYNYSSTVRSTLLADTIELAPLHAEKSPLDWISESNATLTTDGAYSVSRTPSRTRRHLKDALEEYFFNIPTSLASSPELAYNVSAPNAPENVTVTIKKMGNIYTYSPQKLWLAYGLAISITVVNVCIGLLAIFRTGASFTLNFSTIVRAAKNAEVSVDTHESTLPGQDPLPEGWKRATFSMRTPSVELEKMGTGKGEYDSVDQSIEEEGEGARKENVNVLVDEFDDVRRHSWESREAKELQLVEQREREGNGHSHSDEPREDAALVRP